MTSSKADDQLKKVDELVKGDRACVTGYGTANIVHEHHEVRRVTKLYIVTVSISGSLGGPTERRFRRDDGVSTPRRDGYGGTEIHTTCQRLKTKDAK